MGSIAEAFASFKFNIGDRLEFVSDVNDEYYQGAGFIVVERLLQECHGGFQRLYGVRSFGPTGTFTPQINWLSEVELQPAKPRRAVQLSSAGGATMESLMVRLLDAIERQEVTGNRAK